MKKSLNRKIALFGAAIAGAVAINGNAECMEGKYALGAFRAGAGAAPVSATMSAPITKPPDKPVIVMNFNLTVASDPMSEIARLIASLPRLQLDHPNIAINIINN